MDTIGHLLENRPPAGAKIEIYIGRQNNYIS
jgi:hypothetical protein